MDSLIDKMKKAIMEMKKTEDLNLVVDKSVADDLDKTRQAMRRSERERLHLLAKQDRLKIRAEMNRPDGIIRPMPQRIPQSNPTGTSIFDGSFGTYEGIKFHTTVADESGSVTTNLQYNVMKDVAKPSESIEWDF